MFKGNREPLNISLNDAPKILDCYQALPSGCVHYYTPQVTVTHELLGESSGMVSYKYNARRGPLVHTIDCVMWVVEPETDRLLLPAFRKSGYMLFPPPVPPVIKDVKHKEGATTELCGWYYDVTVVIASLAESESADNASPTEIGEIDKATASPIDISRFCLRSVIKLQNAVVQLQADFPSILYKGGTEALLDTMYHYIRAMNSAVLKNLASFAPPKPRRPQYK